MCIIILKTRTKVVHKNNKIFRPLLICYAPGAENNFKGGGVHVYDGGSPVQSDPSPDSPLPLSFVFHPRHAIVGGLNQYLYRVKGYHERFQLFNTWAESIKNTRLNIIVFINKMNAESFLQEVRVFQPHLQCSQLGYPSIETMSQNESKSLNPQCLLLT